MHCFLGTLAEEQGLTTTGSKQEMSFRAKYGTEAKLADQFYAKKVKRLK
jgi:hypothetical protein